MATLDLSRAKTALSMSDPNLVTWAAIGGLNGPSAWGYLTPAGHKVVVSGEGLIYDAAGRPTAGTATSIAIDVGNNGSGDVVITGIRVAAATLDDGAASFWRFLEGDDLIFGPELAKGAAPAFFTLLGDGTAAAPGGAGGRDVIHAGDGGVHAYGDVLEVKGLATPVHYRGGDDEIVGLAGDLQQSLRGDVASVYGGGKLIGGNDTIVIQTRYADSLAVGDANTVVGSEGALARVVGGDDIITGGKDFGGALVGDVFDQHAHTFVRGGDDAINGGDGAELIVGDVYGVTTGRLIGGGDTIFGGGGNDTIAGDVYVVWDDAIVTGGADVIHGGAGDDTVYGDARNGGPTVGGGDRLFGEGGDDTLYGQAGADLIDGGTGSDLLAGGDGDDVLYGSDGGDALYGEAGNDILHGSPGADLMAGGTGDDTYYVDDSGDQVVEKSGEGIDTLWSDLDTALLPTEVEILRFNGVGDFRGTGNALNNVIHAGTGADRLDGGDGNDILIGGAGADAVIGGDGIDAVSYATAAGGVDARLTGNANTARGDARGDTYAGIENLIGSAFDDFLLGDDQANTLFGGAGNDTIVGLGGNDVVAGGVGNDVVVGADGNDVVRGGWGADLLRGGRGSDVFDFNGVAESMPGARDVIQGYEGFPAFYGAGVAGGDVIDLSGIDANAVRAGNQAFVFGGAGIGRVSVATSGTDTVVRCNTDNDAAFEFELVIEDGGVLASAYKALDFVL